MVTTATAYARCFIRMARNYPATAHRVINGGELAIYAELFTVGAGIAWSVARFLLNQALSRSITWYCTRSPRPITG